MTERSLKQSLEIWRGDFSIFFARPLSAMIVGIAAIVIITSTFRHAFGGKRASARIV